MSATGVDDAPSVKAFIGVGANLGFARDAVLNALADLSRPAG